MEQERESNSDNVTPMFSGMINGFSGSIGALGGLPAPIVGERTGENIVLDQSEVKRLKKLLEEERQAVEDAKEAARRRDQFCLALEKRYNIVGYKWNVDFEKQSIDVGEKRN